MAIHLCTHPLALHLLTGLRAAETDPQHFRPLARRLTTLLALEATRDLPTTAVSLTTPLELMEGQVLAQGLVVIPILRAGLAISIFVMMAVSPGSNGVPVKLTTSARLR